MDNLSSRPGDCSRYTDKQMAKLRAGSKIGLWTLDKRLGEGGNGVVWQCHNEDGTRAALKVLKRYLLEATKNQDEQKRRSKRTQRFLDEIKFLQSTHVNGIIPILDCYLPHDPTATDPPWLVMPLGHSLPIYLRDNGRTLANVASIFRDLAAALSALHAEGSAHRDVKPENIVVIDDTPFLSDFGLVHFDAKDLNTSESEILGPLFFVAPEMLNAGGGFDPRPGDVYSMAKSFWVAATGQKFPLPGEQRIGIPALSLSAYVNDPRANHLDKLLDNCTRHSPEERPSANEFFQELTAWCATTQSPAEAMDAVAEIALSLSSTVAKTRSEFDARKQMALWGTELVDAASCKLAPFIDALNKFGFTDAEGRPMPARLIEGENNVLWDQWTYPSVLVDDSEGFVWRGASGTIAQFVQPKDPGTLLISGVRILVHDDERVKFCAAHVCVLGNQSEILWRRDGEASIGTATAHAVLQSLMSELLSVAPKATAAFTSIIRATIAERTSASQ